MFIGPFGQLDQFLGVGVEGRRVDEIVAEELEARVFLELRDEFGGRMARNLLSEACRSLMSFLYSVTSLAISMKYFFFLPLNFRGYIIMKSSFAAPLASFW